MTKQEFLAFSLPYELKTIRRITSDDLPIFSIIGLSYGSINLCRVKPEIGRDYLLPINIIMPILRPLSDLTKEIEHNGEKFIPALELIKLEEKYNNWKDIAPTIPYDIRIINKPFGKVLKVSKVEHWVIYLSLSEIERAKYYIVSQLVKWKFDIANLIPKGEAIDLNILDVNPYM